MIRTAGDGGVYTVMEGQEVLHVQLMSIPSIGVQRPESAAPYFAQILKAPLADAHCGGVCPFQLEPTVREEEPGVREGWPGLVRSVNLAVRSDNPEDRKATSETFRGMQNHGRHLCRSLRKSLEPLERIL